MQAILIDPEKAAVTEISITGKGIKEIQEIIGCRSFTGSGAPLRGNMTTGFDSIYVSDDYLEDRDDPRFWFQVDADRSPPSSFPIAGRGLVVGVGTMGENCDAIISLEDVAKRITFTQRRFRGFKVRQGRGEVTIGGMKATEAIVVDIDAPLLDGMNEGE